MERVLDYLEFAADGRQHGKVRHKVKDCIALAFFAYLASAEKWEDVETFGKEREEFLLRYLELPCGIPSHDTVQRVFASVSPEFLQGFRQKWHEAMRRRRRKSQDAPFRRRKNAARERRPEPESEPHSRPWTKTGFA